MARISRAWKCRLLVAHFLMRALREKNVGEQIKIIAWMAHGPHQ